MSITPGDKFQIGNRSYTVLDSANGAVRYTLEGVTGKPVTLTTTEAKFQKIMASIGGTPAAPPAPAKEQPTPQSPVSPEKLFARTTVPAALREGVIPKASEAAQAGAHNPGSTVSRETSQIGTPNQEGFSDEEMAEFQRLSCLYSGLSDSERYYVVSRWDDEQGLEPTYKRQNFRDASRFRARRRRLWMIVALIPGTLVLIWIGQVISASTQRNEDSFVLDQLRERSNADPVLKSAIEDADRAYQEWIESQRPDPDGP